VLILLAENGLNRNAVYLIGEKMSRKFIRTFKKIKKMPENQQYAKKAINLPACAR
jgi:hypothetical protein